MGLNTFDYVIKLMEVSAESLSISYTKQTDTTLQNWCRYNTGQFVANVGMTEAREPINNSLDNVTFTVSLYFVVSRNANLTPEEKTKEEGEARQLASKFIYLLKQNKFCSVQNNGFDLIFRNGSYLGAGVAGNVSISLPDKDDNCSIFDNTMTKDVGC